MDEIGDSNGLDTTIIDGFQSECTRITVHVSKNARDSVSGFVRSCMVSLRPV